MMRGNMAVAVLAFSLGTPLTLYSLSWGNWGALVCAVGMQLCGFKALFLKEASE